MSKQELYSFFRELARPFDPNRPPAPPTPKDKVMMNRRNFLAAAAAFAPAMFVRAAETKRKVVVVGGGLAGLSCAYELRKLGFEAIVLEGQGRAGGRIKGQHPLIKGTPFSPEIEVAGTVSAVGNEAPFAVGDRVMTTTAYATGWGGFAEYCLADAARAVLAPSHMTNVEAAGFLVPYKTAQVALVQRAVLQQGETLLVLGATGTSGAAAIQFAKALDAQVIAVSSSSAKLDFCREMGADHVINYKTDNILDRVNELTRGRGADVIFDPVGGTLGNQASKAIARRGRFLLIGFSSGSWIQLDPLDIAVRDYSVVGVPLRTPATVETHADHPDQPVQRAPLPG